MIDQELNAFLHELATRCFEEIKTVAAEGCASHGPGIVYVSFTSMAALRNTTKVFTTDYVPREAVKKMEYSSVMPLLDGYEPDHQLVLCGSVDITAPDPNKSNAIFSAVLFGS